MLPKVEDLQNESDVEQKLIYPILTTQKPQGLGLSHSHIKTKSNIKSFQIGKRKNKKVYFPDYIIVMSGLPIVIIEAKPPSDDLDEAYREARLYAIEINANFPHSLNPATKIICTNGQRFISGHWDTDKPTYDLVLDQLHPGNIDFFNFIEEFNTEQLQSIASSLLHKLTPNRFFKPTRLLGGLSVRNEEIGSNTFGNALALDYRHLFNPTSRDERAHIVKNAYIPSKRRDRYIEPIDKVVRAAASPAETNAREIQNTGKPSPIIDALRKGNNIEHQILLLVGSVGSGKSTFVDYLREAALPPDLVASTSWIRINMNDAPLDPARVYNWVCEQIVFEIQYIQKNVDFDELETIQKIYAIEIGRLKKGVLKLLQEGSSEYNSIIVNEILRLQQDKVATAQSYIRHFCAERNKLAIIVFDNCDKRIRDEQLLMFQVAQWIQREFRCLIFLPIRDITYDNHRNEPPLDTALKDLVFRIEPPSFQKVLSKRIALALKEMQEKSKEKIISYSLPNGMRVSYPAEDLACYLNSILKSLFEYDRYLRRMIVGLAGRDLRKAMEIFIEFCTSGHITEDEILKIRQSEGQYAIPFHVVARVLLRVNRRFYSSDTSYVKNLFHCETSDPNPVYFIRLSILRWLHQRFKIQGPTRLPGYHPVSSLKADLVSIGLSDDVISRELIYLLQARCVIAEHLRLDHLVDEDLICIASTGFVHLDLVDDVNYLAAISEDTWFTKEDLAKDIAEWISDKRSHYNFDAALKVSKILVNYLDENLHKPFPSPEVFLKYPDWKKLISIDSSINAINTAVEKRKSNNPWFNLSETLKVGDVVEGVINGTSQHGVFVNLTKHILGLIHISRLGERQLSEFQKGNKLQVRIISIEELRQRIGLIIND